MKTADYWINTLSLQKHPEGGYFKEVYRSDEEVRHDCLPQRFSGSRNFCTSIYFLIKAGQHSKFHKILSDETWHFYYGNPITIFILDEKSGDLRKLNLGVEPEAGQNLQVTVPKNAWFAAMINEKDGYGLVGCTVSPGFDFHDFEMAKQKTLLETFPDQKELILRLT